MTRKEEKYNRTKKIHSYFFISTQAVAYMVGVLRGATTAAAPGTGTSATAATAAAAAVAASAVRKS